MRPGMAAGTVKYIFDLLLQLNLGYGRLIIGISDPNTAVCEESPSWRKQSLTVSAKCHGYHGPGSTTTTKCF